MDHRADSHFVLLRQWEWLWQQLREWLRQRLRLLLSKSERADWARILWDARLYSLGRYMAIR